MGTPTLGQAAALSARFPLGSCREGGVLQMRMQHSMWNLSLFDTSPSELGLKIQPPDGGGLTGVRVGAAPGVQAGDGAGIKAMLGASGRQEESGGHEGFF